eukprot:symbB.v1.2.027874.t1/scaffold2887.1/size85097/1
MARPEEAVEAAMKLAVKESAALKRLASMPGKVSASSDAQAIHARAQGALAEATQRLQVMAQSPVKSDLSAQQLHRVKEQKLRENLQKLSKDLGDAWGQWLKAEEAWQKSVASSPAPAVSADMQSEGSKAQLQRQEEVAAAEVQLHAAMVDEYVQDVANVSQNVRDMQRALLDLALLTEAQGEQLENIEKGMEQASASTDGAVRELRVTQRNQISYRRILCMVLMALLLAVATCAAAIHRSS